MPRPMVWGSPRLIICFLWGTCLCKQFELHKPVSTPFQCPISSDHMKKSTTLASINDAHRLLSENPVLAMHSGKTLKVWVLHVTGESGRCHNMRSSRSLESPHKARNADLGPLRSLSSLRVPARWYWQLWPVPGTRKDYKAQESPSCGFGAGSSIYLSLWVMSVIIFLWESVLSVSIQSKNNTFLICLAHGRCSLYLLNKWIAGLRMGCSFVKGRLSTNCCSSLHTKGTSVGGSLLSCPALGSEG